MGSLLKWFIPAVGFLISFKSSSQKIFFEQLTTAEGLPSDYVNSVFRDSRGFLWIGTDKGASRYDGANFIYLNKDNGLASNFVTCFAEDPDGNIWMGMIEGGICKYDQERIIPFPNEITDIYNNTKQICFNDDRSFFIVTPNSLYYCRSENSVPQKVQDCNGFLAPLSRNNFIAGKGSESLYTLKKENHRLSLSQLGGPHIYKISGNEFIQRNGNQLLSYELKGSEFIFKRKFVLTKNLLSPGAGEVKKMFLTKNALFVATISGLIYEDESNNELFLNSANGLGADYIKDIYEDGEGNLFFCTFGGGVKIWPTQYLKEFKTEGKVTSVFPAGDHTYITTTGNVYNFNPVSNQLSSYPHLRGGNYTVAFQNHQGEFYLGTMNSFYHLPGNAYLGKLIPGAKSGYNVMANSGTSGFITGDESNEVYIGTYGDGIILFDPKSKKTSKYHDKNPGIVEFLTPLKNSFAALTYSSGVMLFSKYNEPVQISTKENLLSNTVYSMFQEKQNEIWIGTFKGLNLYDGKKIIKTFAAGEGLTGTKVICIFRDAQKRFWVLSDKYLHLLENNKLRAIRSHPVLYDPKNSINRAVYDKENDLLYIGLSNSFLTVDLKKVLPDTSIQQPVLSGIRIDTSWKGTDKKMITLSSRSRKISFKFGSFFTPLSKKGDTYYQLRGIDNDWRQLDITSEAIYQKLPAGNYEFFAKTINPDGYSSDEISLLKLEVLPPFWKRTWFIALLSSALLIFFFFTGQAISKKRYHKKIQQLQQEHRLQLERERIAMELHDNVGSQLTYLINKIDDDYLLLSDKNEAGKLSNFARGAMQELRETIWALDKKEISLHDLDYKILQLTALHNKEKNIIYYFANNNSKNVLLKSLQALNIYRIVQESLNNALKYSHAKNININLEKKNGAMLIEVTDDGNGFDINEAEEGYGLRNMKSRALEMNAILKINSEKDKGTTVFLSVPVG